MIQSIKQRLFQPIYNLEGSYNYFVDVLFMGKPGYSNSQIVINCYSN